jgi:hypothetical protein
MLTQALHHSRPAGAPVGHDFREVLKYFTGNGAQWKSHARIGHNANRLDTRVQGRLAGGIRMHLAWAREVPIHSLSVLSS